MTEQSLTAPKNSSALRPKHKRCNPPNKTVQMAVDCV